MREFQWVVQGKENAGVARDAETSKMPDSGVEWTFWGRPEGEFC